ncbi:MAG: 2-succinyl-5-enolpyruvyl-6-hydroxy-3-cyclohexene-1-carboxylate synthase [Cyanobacteria bacterium SIG26]|nr:2-succinyl-5-enolpyruvyl-6-hydroxy-3-cyclohexene-1-carboxylate synthase [Cyanobacteria bacterium SIG26]
MTDTYNTVHYIISMLKAYGIKNIVASPGTQNAYFNSIVQEDSFFKCFSVVDERSAAYVATGIAYETQEPVVITCTGATASRNYMSALTEAYYKNLPVIALTFFDEGTNKFALSPQFVDRSVSQNDIKTVDVELPYVDGGLKLKSKCLTYLNSALFTAKYKKEPVHINCAANMDFKNTVSGLPEDIWSSTGLSLDFGDKATLLKGKNVAIFIGSHNKFTEDEKCAISEFAKSWDIPVLCDHTSNYHGANKILISQIAYKTKDITTPDLIIDMGGVTGEYSCSLVFSKVKKVWRLAENGKFACRSNIPVEYVFLCKEQYFFELMKNPSSENSGYYTYLKSVCNSNIETDLPLSNGLICQKLAKYIPQNSSLHVAILNSLRNMNFFDLDESINVTCNVGGFGIDGAVSTLLGQSLVDSERLCFGVVGDLAFLYDMNAIGNRHVSNNLRIILVNNSRGEEFRLNPALEKPLGEKNDVLIAAAGHFKNGVKGWAQSCDFKYMKANSKRSFEKRIKDFCITKSNKPIILEVYTSDLNEKMALSALKAGKLVLPAKKQKVKLISKLGKLVCGKIKK